MYDGYIYYIMYDGYIYYIMYDGYIYYIMYDGYNYRRNYVSYKLFLLLQMNTPNTNKPKSFGDDQDFDPHSTPTKKDDIKPAIPATSSNEIAILPGVTGPQLEALPLGTNGITGRVVPVVAPTCEINMTPWPTIIISILGAIVVIYSAIAPNVNESRRVFSIVLMILWTLIWALILWVLWRECHRAASWWLLLVPITIIVIFFIVIVVLNMGS